MIETVRRALVPNAAEDPAQPQLPLDINTLLDLIGNVRRRRIIGIVAASNGPIDVREVAKALAAMESGKSPGDMQSDDYKRTYVSVYQTHGPKLAEHGVLSIDKNGVEPVADRDVPELLSTPLTEPTNEMVRLLRESTVGGDRE